MTNITLDGTPVRIHDSLSTVGTKVPRFALVGNDLSPIALADFTGSRLIPNIFPFVDTGICAMSVRTLNGHAAGLENTKVLYISRGLPFAQVRFRGAEEVENVTVASGFRITLDETYRVTMITDPLEGLLAHAVIILDERDNVIHSQLAPEVKQEPDYEAALAALQPVQRTPRAGKDG